MNEYGRGRGPNWGLVLLVPAVVIVAKAAMRRRAMWESAWGPSGPAGGRHGHHAPFADGEVADGAPGGFRLPPRIEWMLDTWHARAHQREEPTEPAAAT